MKSYRNSRNLFDKNNTVIGWITNSGAITSDSYGALSSPTEIIAGEINITINPTNIQPYSYALCWYDSSKNFISRTFFSNANMGHPNTAVIPDNAASFIFEVSCGSSTSDVMTQQKLDSYLLMVVFGSTAQNYEPYNVVDWYSYEYNLRQNNEWVKMADEKYINGSWS